MVELFSSRRRAAEFARALEDGQTTVDARLQGLLDTASRLAAVPLVEPRPEFRDTLRERLLEAAAVELTDPAPRSHEPADPRPQRVVTDDDVAARRRRRLVAVATGLVLVGGGTGVSAASEQSLPGDVLYPVKRTLETAQVALARGGSAEGRALLTRAATRLGEAEVLGADTAATPADLDAVSATLDDFAADAAEGGQRLLRAYASGGDPSDLRTLSEFTRESHHTLQDLAEVLPPQARAAVVAADKTVVRLDDRAFQACPDCAAVMPALTPLSTHGVLLPELGDNASPYVPGTHPLTTPDLNERDRSDQPAKAKGGPGRSSAGSTQAGTGASGPVLPDIDLGEPGRTQQGQAPAAGPGGGSQTQPEPPLDLGGLLGPGPGAPSGPSHPTEGPDLGDVEDLTKPLPDPLGPLLDGARNGLGGVHDGLKNSAKGLQGNGRRRLPTGLGGWL